MISSWLSFNKRVSLVIMKPTNRQLAAIMFTDIVGYTALMGSDESKALSVLRSNRGIHKNLIKKHGGKWLKEMGDGTLASFKSIVDSVYCAGELIKECNQHNIELRIGIHFGDIVFEEGDIFGDGVNVASRLEPIAEPNQIIVSKPIHSNVKNKLGIQSTFIQEKELKNVDEPVKIYRIKVDDGSDYSNNFLLNDRGAIIPKRNLMRLAISFIAIIMLVVIISYFFNPLGESEHHESENHMAKIPKSIAVLPFDDMSADQDLEYLGDGMAEAIINQLTQVDELKVIGRTSSFSFKDQNKDLRTIGKLLKVETILEGSVQRSGNLLRITAQLIEADNGFHIWSDQLESDINDIFELQDELAMLVLKKFDLNSESALSLSSSSDKYENPKAYELYLKGDYFHRGVSAITKEKALENYQLAEKLFFDALKAQDNYPLAHAGLADLYNTYSNSRSFLELNSIEVQKYKDLQWKHIKMAYQYGPYLDYVNLAKGWVHMYYGEIDSAYYSFVRAIKLNPTDEKNYRGLGNFLYQLGLYHEANILLKKAKAINPVDKSILTISAYVNASIGNWNEAVQDTKDFLLLDSFNVLGYTALLQFLILHNEIDSAELVLAKMKSLAPDNSLIRYGEGLLLASKGDTAGALAIRDDVSFYYAKLGMRAEYIETFLKEYEQAKKSPLDQARNYVWLVNRTTYDWIKDDSRIQKIVADEKYVYDSLKAKYGNLDFLDF